MKKLNVIHPIEVVGVFYFKCNITFSNGITDDVVTCVELMYGVDKIAREMVSIVGVPNESELTRDYPKNWKEEVKDVVLDHLDLKWLMAINVDEVRKSLDELTEESSNTLDPENFEYVEYPDEYYEELNNTYESLLNPVEFIKNFKTMDDFEKWADQGDVQDLKAAILQFEKVELYEHCAIMKKIIDKK